MKSHYKYLTELKSYYFESPSIGNSIGSNVHFEPVEDLGNYQRATNADYYHATKAYMKPRILISDQWQYLYRLHGQLPLITKHRRVHQTIAQLSPEHQLILRKYHNDNYPLKYRAFWHVASLDLHLHGLAELAGVHTYSELFQMICGNGKDNKAHCHMQLGDKGKVQLTIPQPLKRLRYKLIDICQAMLESALIAYAGVREGRHAWIAEEKAYLPTREEYHEHH